jgi:hypothetical protein
MTTTIIVLLIGLSVFLGARLHSAVTELTTLRASNAILKKRLGLPLSKVPSQLR